MAMHVSYSILEKRVVVDSNVPATAILTHIGGQSYVLETKEYHPFLGFVFREITIDLKITPSGRVMFCWPDEWLELDGLHTDITEQVKLHTGYNIQGPGINKGTLEYKGFFNGERLYAKAHFTGQQIQPGTFGDYIGQWVEGPVQFEFSLDLSVD